MFPSLNTQIVRLSLEIVVLSAQSMLSIGTGMAEIKWDNPSLHHPTLKAFVSFSASYKIPPIFLLLETSSKEVLFITMFILLSCQLHAVQQKLWVVTAN